MKSLAYLLRTSFKNTLLEVLHKPARLLLYVVMIGLLGITLVTASTTRDNGATIQPLIWLFGIYFSLLLLFFGMSIQKGLTTGDTIFEMNDVNFLFAAPLEPRAILLYGLVRLAKVSLLGGFFILFQGSTLAQFGVRFSGVLTLFFVFILTITVLTLFSLLLYSQTNGNPNRQRLVKIAVICLFLPAAAHFALQFFSGTAPALALTNTLSSLTVKAIPLVGWAASGAIALLAGNILSGLLWLGLLVFAGVGMVVYIMLGHLDYYEDVLVATETAFQKKRAAAEGDLQATMAATGRARVTKTGIRGLGASTFFYKHLRETLRQNRFGFLSLSNVAISASIVLACVLFPDYINLMLIVNILFWLQIMLIGNSRGLLELYSHYIYLIPARPFKKVVWSNLLLVFRTLIESVFFFGIPGLLLRENPFLILSIMLLYTLFSFLLLGVNYLFVRFTGAEISKGLLLTIYFLAVLLFMAPGLVPAIIVGSFIGGTWGTIVGVLLLSAWELLAALACFFASRHVLQKCDMPTAQMMTK